MVRIGREKKSRRQNALQKLFLKNKFFLTQTNFFPVARPLVAPFVIACHKLVARASLPCQVELWNKGQLELARDRKKANAAELFPR